MKFAPWKRSLPARSPSVGGPPTADQLSMPPEQGLRAGQQRSPSRPGQRPTDGSEENAIGRLPPWSADLSLEHAQLVAKGQDLGAKPGIRTSVDGQGLQEQADNSVGKGEEHGGEHRRDWVDAGRRRGVGPDELTRTRLTGQGR
jgi:hypothetical protein